MAIQNRELTPGMVLSGTYKKACYRCQVEAEDERLVFVLGDGLRFKSVSAAASAIMEGKAVNGWLFWSLDEAQPKEPVEPRKPKGFRRVAGETPAAGPQGHRLGEEA